MKVFLIGPVRNVTEEERDRIGNHVKNLESLGHKVHWSIRDVDQVDPIGLRICLDNLRGMRESDEVHVWWNPASQGSIFDLGMALALGKKVVMINTSQFQHTENKSFTNVLLALQRIDQSVLYDHYPSDMSKDQLQQLLDHINQI
ncbi:MAG: hypothetical protein AAB847_00290 [Patescibacteria group bacterium]